MSRRTGLYSKNRVWRMGDNDNYRKKNVSDTKIGSIENPGVACYSGKKIVIIL